MGVAQSKFGTFVGAAAVICAAANAKGRAIASVGVDSDAKVSSTKDTIEAKPKCPHGHTKEQNMSAAGTANVAAAQFLGTGKDASQTLLSPSRQSSSDHEFVSQRGHKGVYYHDYLKLDLILGAQAPKSQELGGKMAHEEMLFVIIHQTYELWFKQVLHDLDSCRGFLRLNFVPEYALGTVSRRLSRITLILHQLVNQLGILETMTPLDFLDFRDFLFPASGFQSVQFRLLENALGLRHDHRLQYAKNDYCSRLSEPHKDVVLDSEKSDSLFELIQRWLERTPFLESQDYDFWSAYEKAVGKMFNAERSALLKAPVSEEERATQLKELEHTENSFRVIFDEARYNEELKSNRRRLSFKANKAAILISLYRDQPIFQMPHQILMLLVDIDGLLTQWRERHAQMVHRMLGAKIGTGGSSGYHYLKATAGRHKIFSDFSNLSMFLIPRSALPRLPPSIVERLQFHYSQ